MAKTKGQPLTSFLSKSKNKRPGVHAKSKTSKTKTSKNYVKSYVAQGK
jgi:hypothetical protein